MTFYTFPFLLLFAVLSILVLSTPLKFRNYLLLAASLVFYAFGSIPNLILFAAYILLTYCFGLLIGKKRTKILIAIFVVMSLLPLFLFKYLNWLLGMVGLFVPAFSDLPIGISFFSFQAVGYLIEVYRGKVTSEKNILNYGLFLSFFPQVTAGPINSADKLLPQIASPVKVSPEAYKRGLVTMAQGLFYKVFCATASAYVVDAVFSNIGKTSSLFLIATVFLYGFQIYWDFNGYTLMALGCAKCVGIEMQENFRRPYLSTSITDFWRRWHISLSTWFKKYLYFPLGGSRCGIFRRSFNLFITFAISGIWHGAEWTFLIWGCINGLCLVAEKLLKIQDNSSGDRGRRFAGWIYTYLIVNIAWLFFRADNMAVVGEYLGGIVNGWGRSLIPSYLISTTPLWKLAMTAIAIVATVIIDLVEEKKDSSLSKLIGERKWYLRWAVYIMLLVLPLCFGEYGSASTFIYSRF